MTIFHRLDVLREHLETLPEDHAMRPYWKRVEKRLLGELSIMVAERQSINTPGSDIIQAAALKAKEQQS